MNKLPKCAVIAGLAWAAGSVLISSAVAQSQGNLDQILKKMDTAAAAFHTTEASFEWVVFEKVTGDQDTQKGKVYFRREGSRIEMAADVSDPKPPKYLLFTGDKIELYETGINRVTVYDAGQHRADFETFLVLGFGGSGQDLQKSFNVTYKGTEQVGEVNATLLDLVPKSEKIRNNFPHIALWIDPDRGVSVRQKLYETSGDYRQQNYSDIVINKKIADSVFKLKTNAKTETVTKSGN